MVVAEDGKTKLFPVILLPKEKLVDTNGAGIWSLHPTLIGKCMERLSQHILFLGNLRELFY